MCLQKSGDSSVCSGLSGPREMGGVVWSTTDSVISNHDKVMTNVKYMDKDVHYLHLKTVIKIPSKNSCKPKQTKLL